MNKNIDLTKILKYCPCGWKFWSPIFGEVIFTINQESLGCVNVAIENGDIWSFNADATLTIGNIKSVDIMLYPSREQRDWSKFTAPWLKKERFDPKTLKPFDKIIFKGHGMWFCGLFSHIHNSYACVGETYYKCVIPYNDETKHLVGTTEEAPEYYRYWED